MTSLVSFFQSLVSPTVTMRQVTSLTKEIKRIDDYLDTFDRHEFEADYILTAPIQDLTNLDKFENELNLRTIEHLHSIFNYLSILNKKLEELKTPV